MKGGSQGTRRLSGWIDKQMGNVTTWEKHSKSSPHRGPTSRIHCFGTHIHTDTHTHFPALLSMCVCFPYIIYSVIVNQSIRPEGGTRGVSAHEVMTKPRFHHRKQAALFLVECWNYSFLTAKHKHIDTHAHTVTQQEFGNVQLKMWHVSVTVAKTATNFRTLLFNSVYHTI